MAYWLMKQEPEIFGIDDLEKIGKPVKWKKSRNYQVRNSFRDDMNPGDLAFFYHSNAKPAGVAGVMRIASEAYPDPTQFDPDSNYYDPKSKKDSPTWLSVDVEFVEKFDRVIPLTELKSSAGLEDMWVCRKGNRISVTPVTAEEWAIVLKLAESD
jgi:predicted RNA-binding protein with PUA-like domain